MTEPPNPEASESNFPPIGDYAFLSDCENSCLEAPTGSIEWMCLPKPHDPSIFGTILDRAAGSFRFAPVDSAVPAHRQYDPGTMMLSTTWQTRSGWLEISSRRGEGTSILLSVPLKAMAHDLTGNLE